MVTFYYITFEMCNCDKMSGDKHINLSLRSLLGGTSFIPSTTDCLETYECNDRRQDLDVYLRHFPCRSS